MNINEDKFLNKSAKEIVDDMLSQHKTPSDALAHTNELLNDDGLSDKTKEELKKAANMLQDKTNEKELNEGKWLSAIKSMFNPQPKPGYTVELVCYPPFKKEPEVIKLDNIQSLDDPQVDEAYKSIRRLHPKSQIRLYSKLGNKTFYENSSAEYQIKAYDKESNRVDSFNAGTLPQAMAMCEKMWNANDAKYKSIEVIHDNDVVTTYNGLEEGFTMDMGAPDPDDSNSDKKDKNQNNEEPQVNPDDPVTTIKDKDGNDVNVSISQDAQTVSIDGQPIEKNTFDQAIEDLKKQADEINKKAKEKDQNPEDTEDQDQKNDNDQTEENPEKEQDQKDDQTNDSSEQNDTEDITPEEDEYSDEDFYSDTENLGKKGQFQLNKDMSAYDADIEKQNQAKAYADELKKQQDDIAAEREMRDFDIQQEREKRDADLAADRNKETKRKSYKDQGGKSLLNKILTSDTARNLAAAGAGAALGFAPSNELTKPYTDHGIDRIDAYNKETQRMNKAKHDYDLKADRNKEIDKAADERLKAKRAKEDQMRQNKNSAVAYKRQDDTQRTIDQKLQRQNLQKQLTRKYANTSGMTRADDIERDAQLAAQRKAARDAAMNKQTTVKKSKASQYNKNARDAINAKLNKKKSESLNEAELQHSWVDTHNDIANIDEFLELARNGIHPGLADTRRPKFHNIFANRESDKYVEIDDQPAEILVVLDGVEQIKHPTTGEPVNVAIIKEKVPVSINPETGSFTYKDGERHEITFNQFKKLINDDTVGTPTNAETLQGFEKSHPDDPEIVYELYSQAKENMDSMYPSWEKAYWDEYDLENYNAVERGKIYLRWKEAQEDRAFQDGHELTADEVKREFALPKLQSKLQQLSSFAGKSDQQAIDSLLKQLPENKANELLDKVNDALEDCYGLNLIDAEKKIGEFMSTTPAVLACENIIDKLTGNTLQKLEDSIPFDKKDEFESKKAALLDKYIKKATLHGVTRAITDPRIMSRRNEIIKDLDDLRKEYGISKWGMDVNQVKQKAADLMKAYLNPKKPIQKSDDELIRDFGKSSEDFENWKKDNISSYESVGFVDKDGKLLDPVENNYTASDAKAVKEFIDKKKSFESKEYKEKLKKAKEEYDQLDKEVSELIGGRAGIDVTPKRIRLMTLRAELINNYKTGDIDNTYLTSDGKLNKEKILDTLNNSPYSNEKFTAEDVDDLQKYLDFDKAKSKWEDLREKDRNKQNILNNVYVDVITDGNIESRENLIDRILHGDIKIVDNAKYNTTLDKRNYIYYLRDINKPVEEPEEKPEYVPAWEEIVNNSFFNSNNDAENGIGILDRIDRSLKAYKDVDTKGIRLSGKYHKLLDNILDQLKAQYPEGNEEEVGDVIKSWYNDILKPEIAKDSSVGQKLKNYVVTDQIGDSSEE